MLTALARIVARGVVSESRLVCPDCGGPIVLAGRYWCDGPLVNGEHRPSCGFMSPSLEPLARVPMRKGAP